MGSMTSEVERNEEIQDLSYDYKFVVDCKKEHCKMVQEHMRGLGFDVKLVPSTFGDHYGIKRFDTPKEVETLAQSLVDKFKKEVRHITVLLAE